MPFRGSTEATDMVATVENIKATDPNEQALDGTVGGKLDQMNPESTEKDDGGGVSVTPKPNDVINQAVVAAIEKIEVLKAERKEINAVITSIIEGLEAKGINRHSFRYAMKVLEMSEDQRAGLDLSYLLCRQATGMLFQTDWIDEIE